MLMRASQSSQRGSFILEALIAILIFCMGVLGLISLQGTAIATNTDTRYRVEANQFAERIFSTIQANASRASDTSFQASLNGFAHQPDGGDPGSDQCNFSGAASTSPLVDAWLDDLSGAASAGRLPEADAQIRITWGTGTANQIRVVLCWRQPGFSVMRRHIVTGSIS